MTFLQLYLIALFLLLVFMVWELTVLYLAALEVLEVARRYLLIKEKLSGDYDRL